MMTSEEIQRRIGQAWIAHRTDDNKTALTEFQNIAQADSTSMDAYFGLGLVQRSQGQYEAAIASLQRALELTEKALEASPGEDRYEMLIRMTRQRLAETRKKLEQ